MTGGPCACGRTESNWWSHGVCGACLRRQRYVPHPRPSVEQRFWAKVNKDGPIHPVLGTACWLWTAYTTTKGYGVFGLHSSTTLAHRFAFGLAAGRPTSAQVLHKCDVPACIRADHLFEGSNDDNVADRCAKGRSARGERASSAKVTEAQVREIRRRYPAETQTQIAKDYGIRADSVSRIIHRKRWKYLE